MTQNQALTKLCQAGRQIAHHSTLCCRQGSAPQKAPSLARSATCAVFEHVAAIVACYGTPVKGCGSPLLPALCSCKARRGSTQLALPPQWSCATQQYNEHSMPPDSKYVLLEEDRPHPGAFFRYSVATGRCDWNSTDDAGPVYCRPGGSRSATHALLAMKHTQVDHSEDTQPSAARCNHGKGRARCSRASGAQLTNTGSASSAQPPLTHDGKRRRGRALRCVSAPRGTPSREPLWGAWTTGS